MKVQAQVPPFGEVDVPDKPVWAREDGSVLIAPGPGHHVDMSNDFGRTWDAFSPDEARSLAAALCVAAAKVEEREE